MTDRKPPATPTSQPAATPPHAVDISQESVAGEEDPGVVQDVPAASGAAPPSSHDAAGSSQDRAGQAPRRERPDR